LNQHHGTFGPFSLTPSDAEKSPWAVRGCSRVPVHAAPRAANPPIPADRQHHHRRVALTDDRKMPLVRVDLLEGRSPQFLQLLSQTIHATMISHLSVLERDYFQIISTEREPYQLLFSRDYLDLNRTDKHIFIHMFLSAGRTGETKERFFKGIERGGHEDQCGGRG
jgi:4-oxalocrotonate tautomerase